MSNKSQLTGNIGLYYSCYRLSQFGWNVMPTTRNARGVDVIAYSEDATRLISIQVKALSRRVPVPLGKDLSSCMGNFWVIVTNAGTASPSTFVMTPDEVRALAHCGRKDDRVSYWLQPGAYDRDSYREAWHRIGRGGAST